MYYQFCYLSKSISPRQIAPVGMEIYILRRPRFRFKLYAYIYSKLNKYSKLTMNLYVIFEGPCIERTVGKKLHSKSYFTEIREWNLHKSTLSKNSFIKTSQIMPKIS